MSCGKLLGFPLFRHTRYRRRDSDKGLFEMKQAVIVSTARTPIGKAYRGAFNNTEGPTMASHAIRAAIERARASGARQGEAGCAALGLGTTTGLLIHNPAVERSSVLSGAECDCESGVFIRFEIR